MPRMLRYWRDVGGSSAVETVLVLPMCVFLTLGAINLFLVVYADVGLHRAVEDTARYASTWTADNSAGTGSTTYPSSATVLAHAATAYQGPGVSQSFTYANPTSSTCGMHRVSATGHFKLVTGLFSPTVTLNAAACYP